MASQVFENEFLTRYKDDFRDSDNYYRILFNSGRNLQARELTQIQSIIQAEIGRLGRYLFKENALISGGDQTYDQRVGYVKLDTVVNDYALPTDYKTLVGKVVQNTSGVKARIKAVVPAGTDDPNDPATLLVVYIDANGTESADESTPVTFLKNQVLTYPTTEEVGSGSSSLKVINQADAIGNGSMTSIPQSIYFNLGHFVYVYGQDIVLDKYNSKPTLTIGFQVDEEIVTTDDDVALFDNSGVTPNLSSPGADRYRIRLTLIRESDAAEDKTFIPAFKYKNGKALPLGGGEATLNKLSDIMARRTFEESGDYVVQNLDAVVYDNDSDENYFRVKLTTPGVAYRHGRRYSYSSISQDYLRGEKPRTTTKKENQSIVVDYSGYILCTDLRGLVDLVATRAQLTFKDAAGWTGNSIGTANVQAIDKVSDTSFRIHLFNVKMNSSKQVGDAFSIGTSTTNYVNFDRGSGSAYIQDPQETSLLFPLPMTRPAAITDTVLTVVKSDFAGVVVSGGSATFNTGNAELVFADEDEWILTYTDGTTRPAISISAGGAGSTSVTFNGLTNAKTVKLLSYVTKTGRARSKTLTSVASETRTPAASSGTITLANSDIFELVSVVDDGTSEDITLNYSLDNGARDASYERGRLVMKSGETIPAGTVTVAYKYFAHGTGDYFNVESYKASYGILKKNGLAFSYKDIPTHRLTTGQSIELRNVMDFRSVDTDNNNATGYETINALPRNRDTITADIDYYNASNYAIAITGNGTIKMYDGADGLPPAAVSPAKNDLLLHTISIQPYMINAADLTITSQDNKRYTMKDIRALEKRVANVEELTSLTLLELSTDKLTVVDENGLARTKLGIFADEFKDTTFADLSDPSFRSSIDTVLRHVQPAQKAARIQLIYDSAESTGTIKKGHYIFPKYSEAVLINQPNATDVINTQPFTVSLFDGKITLSPKSDSWTQTVYVEAKSSSGTTEYVVDDGDIANISPADRGGIDPTYGWTDLDGAKTSTSSGRTTTTSGLVEEISATVSRARFVSFKIEGLKPSTKHFIYFNKQNVDVWCKTGSGMYTDLSNLSAGHKYAIPDNKYVSSTEYPIDGGPTASHVTNSQGVLEGVFFLQSNASVYYPIGSIMFEVVDVNSVTNNAWTSYAKGTYTCAGEIDVYLQNVYTSPPPPSSSTTTTSGEGGGFWWVILAALVIISDERLKVIEDQQSIDNPIDKLSALKIVNFKYKPELANYGINVDYPRTGAMAQQVQQVYPQAVQKVSFGGNDVLTINYGELIPDLIKAVVEQQQLINQLAQRVDDLILKVKEND